MPEPNPIVSTLALALFLAIIGAWTWAIVRLGLRLPILPPRTPRIVPWGAGSVLVVMLTWLLLMASIPAAYVMATRHRPPPAAGAVKPVEELSAGEKMTLSAVQNTATLALIPVLLFATCGARLRDLGIVATGFGKQIVRGVVTYPLIAPIVFGVMFLAIRALGRTNHPLQDAMTQDRSPAMVAILVLAGVILAPIVEELIFRGVFLGWLTRLVLVSKKPESGSGIASSLDEPHPGDSLPYLIETVEFESMEGPVSASDPETVEQAIPDQFLQSSGNDRGNLAEVASNRALPLFAANVIVSLVFGTLHGAVWPTPVPIFFLSLGLGFLYQRTGSIIAPIALHMVFNGMSTLVLFLTVGTEPPLKPEPKVPIPPPAIEIVERCHRIF